MLSSKLQPIQPMCSTASPFGRIWAFVEYYHWWISVLIWQKLQPLENIITRASYAFPDVLSARMSPHYGCPIFTLHRKQFHRTRCGDRQLTATALLLEEDQRGMTEAGCHPTVIYTPLFYKRIAALQISFLGAFPGFFLYASLSSNRRRSWKGIFPPAAPITAATGNPPAEYFCLEQKVLQLPSRCLSNNHSVVYHVFLTADTRSTLFLYNRSSPEAQFPPEQIRAC